MTTIEQRCQLLLILLKDLAMGRLKPQDNYRTITVIPKATSANTQYYDMNADDEAYIYEWLIRFLAELSETATHDEELKKEWFRRRPEQFPKGKHGPNSISSMLGGIVAAKMINGRHNFTDATLDAVESLFSGMAGYYSELDRPPQPVKFRRSLFEYKQ